MGVPRNHREAAASAAIAAEQLNELQRGKSAASVPRNVDAEYRAKARGERDVKPNAFDRGRRLL
jgi:hypothetical protein